MSILVLLASLLCVYSEAFSQTELKESIVDTSQILLWQPVKLEPISKPVEGTLERVILIRSKKELDGFNIKYRRNIHPFDYTPASEASLISTICSLSVVPLPEMRL